MIDANTKSLTSNRAVFYVAISRPRHELTIYTDSRAKLADTMIREPKKFAALELRGLEQENALLGEALRRHVVRQEAHPNRSDDAPQRSARRRKI
jgi:hypothetical protein